MMHCPIVALLCSPLLALMLARAASAADICKAIALRDVGALEDASSVIGRGSYDTAITQYLVNKGTGQTSFCSHGGYCYPQLLVDGKTAEALRLTNCSVVRAHPYDDGDNLIYDVDVLRSKVPAAQLRQDDLDNRFLQMGLCSACASNVAHRGGPGISDRVIS